MSERIYQWTMRNGARILLCVATFELIGGLGMNMYMAVVARPNIPAFQGFSQTVMEWGTAILSAVLYAALPFFGALLVDRLDRHRQNSN